MGNTPSDEQQQQQQRQQQQDKQDPIVLARSPEGKYSKPPPRSPLLMSSVEEGSSRGAGDDMIDQMIRAESVPRPPPAATSGAGMGEMSLGFTTLGQVKRMARRDHSRRRDASDNSGLGDSSMMDRLVLSIRPPSGSVRAAAAAEGGQSIDENSVLLSKPSGDSTEGEDPPQTTWEVLMDIIFGKFVSIFLICIPFAFMAKYMGWGDITVFWLNFFVMIPLAAILGDFTEELALHTNQVIGGLINASFGNAVEVVVAIEALYANEIRVVQASMIGSIFSNLLLVLGCCFFFGGLKYPEQSFNATAATANMSLLALASIALVLPTPFSSYYNIDDDRTLIISRTAAVFLLSMYIQLLIFQLKTHAHLFGDEDSEKPSISMTVAIIGLCTVTASITMFSDMLVASIDGFVTDSGISRTFVGLIILPIVGNAVEHITAITVAMKNKMDLSMAIAVGSCTQIALFVVPLTVLVGWAMDRHMTLNFPHFEIILFTLSVIIVSIILSNPKGNWLEGSLLITTYFMVAVGFYYEEVEDF